MVKKILFKSNLIVLFFFLQGCNTGGGYKAEPSYSVGPSASYYTQATEKKRLSTNFSRQLSILVIPFAPNIPSDTKDYKKKNIWPELRRAEGNYFAVKLSFGFKCGRYANFTCYLWDGSYFALDSEEVLLCLCSDKWI